MKSKLQLVLCLIAFALPAMAMTTITPRLNATICACCDHCTGTCCGDCGSGICSDCCDGQCC
ncbi:MAG TPA: hypothetical protein VFB04_08485 [Terriglobales bacterium]|nr:hypothetical protein [Terriglobales bacterium]